MTYVDWALLGVIAISTLVGLLRGFVKEVFALAVWLAALLVAFRFAGDASQLVPAPIELPSARTAIGFTGLFLLVLAVGALLTYLVGQLVDKTGLTGSDRLLGGVFGVLRGLLLAVALVMVGGFTPLPRDPWWQESRVIGSLIPLAEWAAEYLPEPVREHFDLYGAGGEAEAAVGT